MTDFEQAVNYVIQKEGGLEQDKADSGGITKYGISAVFLRSLTVDKLKQYGIIDTSDVGIMDLTLDQAKAVYKGEFWNESICHILNSDVGNYFFDMCVNMGAGSATKCLQRAVWAVLGRWELLPDDGVLGNLTLSLVNQCGLWLKNPLKCERGAYYREIVRMKPDRKVELNGWLNRTYNK